LDTAIRIQMSIRMLPPNIWTRVRLFYVLGIIGLWSTSWQSVRNSWSYLSSLQYSV